MWSSIGVCHKVSSAIEIQNSQGPFGWRELFKILDSQLNISFSYHPQIDGQTEQFNGLQEEYLRHFVQANQKNWPPLLDVAQFCFNAKKSSSTNKSPFEIVTGQQPSLPHISTEPYKGKSL